MLSEDQLRFFRSKGYLAAEGVLDPETVLAPVIAEYDTVLHDLFATWVAEGRIDRPIPDASFEDRIIGACKAGCDYFQPMDISLPGGAVTRDTPFHAGPAIFRLMTDPTLLDCVEQLIGPEITSNPIQHVRIKPPASLLDEGEVRAHITRTEWHQDRGVTLPEADATTMVTAWCAITDATVENGCLQVIPGSHKADMLSHCPLPQVGIPQDLIEADKAVPVPVASGGVVFFHPLTIHGSLANESSGIRWSFDLRYSRSGEPTGRPQFPEFVARSRRVPHTVLSDPDAWRESWLAARDRLAQDTPRDLHRWPADAPLCA